MHRLNPIDQRNHTHRKHIFLLIAICSLASALTHIPPGTLIDDVEMPTLSGDKQHLLTNATANVIIFFKPGQQNSRDALKQLASVERSLSGKPVHWVAIVSDRIPKADAEAAVKEAGISMPVLIDQGDALYGKLGVALTPVTVITGQDHKLDAYQPFTRINYAPVIRAHIRHLLKEISDDELAATLKPPAADDIDTDTAHRRLKLAEELFAAKKYPQAFESVTISIAKDPRVAAAHLLRGNILAAQGKCSEAVKSYQRALQLAPENARAAQGIKECEGKP